MPLLLPSWLQGTKYIFQHRFLQFGRGVKSETWDDSLNYRPLIIFTSARRILYSNHNNKQIKFQMNLFLPNEIIISRLNVTKETKVVINLMQQNIKDTWYVQITENKTGIQFMQGFRGGVNKKLVLWVKISYLL